RLRRQRVFDGENVFATIAGIFHRLLGKFETRATHLARLVAPDLILRALAAQGWRRDAEAVALACDQAHRGDALRALVAHDRFLVRVRGGCGGHCSFRLLQSKLLLTLIRRRAQSATLRRSLAPVSAA